MPDSPDRAPANREPYSENDGATGKAAVWMPSPDNTHRDLLQHAGFNPDEWQITGRINTRQWMTQVKGEPEPIWVYYYKFDVVAGESEEAVEEHIDDLVKLIRRHKRQKLTVPFVKTDGFAYFASDWQIGKREGNDGTPETIQRVMKSFDMAYEEIKHLRRRGRKMPELLFAGTGDILEGTCGFYPGQQFLIDRTRREQNKIARELITAGLDYLSPLFESTKVAAVGGNHGENRGMDGKRITSDGDNDDCAVFEGVQEAFVRAGDNNISWDIMQDELSMAVEIGGVPVGLTHGHIFQKGTTPQLKALNWWMGQDFGFQAVRGTQILVSSHFHHHMMTEHGFRTHIQTAAMDPGSKWVRDISGQNTPPGVLTMRFDGTTVRGWDDMKVLTPTT